MKKTGVSVWLILVLAGMFSAAATAVADVGQAAGKSDGVQTVLADISAQVVSQLPDDVHFRLLAIGPIDGDDGRLAQALTVEIKKKTHFHLVERNDLDRLLEEQGIQLSAISDERQPVTPGRIKGVEGLLMGKVTARRDTPFYSSLDVFLKLDNVESGDIVFAQHFSARHIPVLTYYAAGIAAVLLFFMVCANRFKKQKIRKISKVVEKDSVTLAGLQDELRKARDIVNQAHDRLIEQNMMPAAVAVRKVREDMGYLLDRLAQTPAVYSASVNKTTRSDLNTHGKLMQGLVKNVLAESVRLNDAIGGDETRVQAAVDRLGKEIRHALGRLQDRPSGKS